MLALGRLVALLCRLRREIVSLTLLLERNAIVKRAEASFDIKHDSGFEISRSNDNSSCRLSMLCAFNI